MKSQKKGNSKKDKLRIMEHTIVNHSFIIEALIGVIVDSGVCSLAELQQKIKAHAQLVDTAINNSKVETNNDDDDDTPYLSYFGPMGEA